jgi:hypothetical protein
VRERSGPDRFAVSWLSSTNVSLFCIASSARLLIPETVTVTDGVVAPGGNTSIRSVADSTTMMFPVLSMSSP